MTCKQTMVVHSVSGSVSFHPLMLTEQFIWLDDFMGFYLERERRVLLKNLQIKNEKMYIYSVDNVLLCNHCNLLCEYIYIYIHLKFTCVYCRK